MNHSEAEENEMSRLLQQLGL
jgi:hypothetical protein